MITAEELLERAVRTESSEDAELRFRDKWTVGRFRIQKLRQKIGSVQLQFSPTPRLALLRIVD